MRRLHQYLYSGTGKVTWITFIHYMHRGTQFNILVFEVIPQGSLYSNETQHDFYPQTSVQTKSTIHNYKICYEHA